MLVCLWIQGSCCSWIPNSHCLRDAISSVSPAWSCDPSAWKPIIYEDWYIGECLIYEHWYIFDLYSNNIWRPRRLIYEDWYIFLIYIPIIYEDWYIGECFSSVKRLLIKSHIEDWYIGEINVCWRLLYAESAGDYCMFLLNLAGDYAESAGDYLRWRQLLLNLLEIICVEDSCWRLSVLRLSAWRLSALYALLARLPWNYTWIW